MTEHDSVLSSYRENCRDRGHDVNARALPTPCAQPQRRTRLVPVARPAPWPLDPRPPAAPRRPRRAQRFKEVVRRACEDDAPLGPRLLFIHYAQILVRRTPHAAAPPRQKEEQPAASRAPALQPPGGRRGRAAEGCAVREPRADAGHGAPRHCCTRRTTRRAPRRRAAAPHPAAPLRRRRPSWSPSWRNRSLCGFSSTTSRTARRWLRVRPRPPRLPRMPRSRCRSACNRVAGAARRRRRRPRICRHDAADSERRGLRGAVAAGGAAGGGRARGRRHGRRVRGGRGGERRGGGRGRGGGGGGGGGEEGERQEEEEAGEPDGAAHDGKEVRPAQAAEGSPRGSAAPAALGRPAAARRFTRGAPLQTGRARSRRGSRAGLRGHPGRNPQPAAWLWGTTRRAGRSRG